MRENPERFIESNTEYSWLQHLDNMSMQGTWCDGMIIQVIKWCTYFLLTESNQIMASNTK